MTQWKKNFLIFIGFVLFGIIAMFITVASYEKGSYFPLIFFPISYLLEFFNKGPADKTFLLFIQYPIYGLLAIFFKKYKAIYFILAMHIICVIFCFLFFK